MIPEIRSYLRQAVKLADPDLVENPSAFYDGDIGESLLDRSFQITINNLTANVRNSHIERTLAAQVMIFGIGYLDAISRYDDLLDKAVCIEDNIINLRNFFEVATITNIESSGITAEKIPSNDNAFQITINLTLTQAYERE